MTTLVLDDYIFTKSMKVAASEGIVRPRNEVYQWARRVYAANVAIAIRRLLDSDDRTYSLLLLIRKIHNNPQVITRRSFVWKYRRLQPELRFLGDKDFDGIAGVGTLTLSRAVVAADLAKLEKVATRILPLVDKIVAHHERKPKGLVRVTWGEIHDTVGKIAAMCARYNLVLFQEGVYHRAGEPPFLPSITAGDADRDIQLVWGRRP